MSSNPYLSFTSNCSGAITYYQRILDTEPLYEVSFSEMPRSTQGGVKNCPSGMQFPDAVITHTNVRIAGSDIITSDAISPGRVSYFGFTLVLDS